MEQNPCLRDSGPCFLQQLDGGCGVLKSGLANGGFWSSRIKIARLHLQVKPSKNMSMQYYFILTSSVVSCSPSKSIDNPSIRRRTPLKSKNSKKRIREKKYLLLYVTIKKGEIKTPSGRLTHTQHLVPAGNFAERLSFFPRSALNFLGIRYPGKYGFFPIRLFHSEIIHLD